MSGAGEDGGVHRMPGTGRRREIPQLRHFRVRLDRTDSAGGPMFTVTETVSIDRSVQEVFDFLSDPGNRSRWDATVISEELTSPDPVGVGSTIHTRMRAFTREVDFDWRVTQFDAPNRMAVVSTEGLMATSLTFAFAAVGGGCVVTATIEGEPDGLMRMVEPLIAGGVRATLAEGLERAKALLEADG